MTTYAHVIDVSAHQGDIDWRELAKPNAILSPNGKRYDVEAIVFKSVEGDEEHRASDELYEGARSIGRPTGGYGYLTPGRGYTKTKLQDPIEEAEAIFEEERSRLRWQRMLTGDLEDWEAIEAAGIDELELTRWMALYLGSLSGLLLRERWLGELSVYGRRAVARLLAGWGIERIASCWVPRYRTRAEGVHSGAFGDSALGELPGPYKGSRWLMHQYTSQGKVEGIEGRVDLNVMRREDFRRIFGPRAMPTVVSLAG